LLVSALFSRSEGKAAAIKARIGSLAVEPWRAVKDLISSSRVGCWMMALMGVLPAATIFATQLLDTG
jgi:hypothetical protein